MNFVDYLAIAGWLIVVVQNGRRVAEWVVGLVEWARGLGK